MYLQVRAVRRGIRSLRERERERAKKNPLSQAQGSLRRSAIKFAYTTTSIPSLFFFFLLVVVAEEVFLLLLFRITRLNDNDEEHSYRRLRRLHDVCFFAK